MKKSNKAKPREVAQPRIEGINAWRDLFELILDNVYSGIIFCDKDSRIVFMNQVYAELLNTDRDAAVGKHITEFFPSSRLPKVLERGQAELGERCSLKYEMPLLVNRIPLRRGNEMEGVILQTLFKDYAGFRDLVTRMKIMEREVSYYKESLSSVLSAKFTFDSIIGQSKVINQVKGIAEKYARTDAPVLILGPTGSGKELFAQAVHSASQRSAGAFVCLNCGAIPRELLESELFGYESGAFTGASRKGKPGKIELAHGGTLYLDEIGDLPFDAQAALLRVLETKVIEKVGGLKSIDVDFRLVAATNRDLKDLIRRGGFREDLYYRLNTMTLQIPSLAERSEDVPLLIAHFLKSAGMENLSMTDPAQRALMAYPWPGNIRELKNVVERAVSLAEGRAIELEHLPGEFRSQNRRQSDCLPSSLSSLSDEMARYEKELLLRALEESGNNMSRAAKLLGVSRSTLYEKFNKHRILSDSSDMSENQDNI